MDERILEQLPEFLAAVGADEEPMGLFFTDKRPGHGFTPKPLETPTREKEQQNALDWRTIFGTFSCVMGHIWRARVKKTAAWFSAENYGCPGGAFFLGFIKPQTETIIHYVSTGIPDRMEGERYCGSPDALRRVFAEIDPWPSPKPYCVVQPLSLFEPEQVPEVVIFFSRPEALCGLHQLAFFVTEDPEVVASPWSAACGGIAAWPLRYKARGMNRAVVGGWDPSGRKFYKTDELTFTVPFAMLETMLEKYKDSFLVDHKFETVRKKIVRSKKAWGEITD